MAQAKSKRKQSAGNSLASSAGATGFTARPHVMYEANLAQLKKLRPNVAVLPWGAAEAHNYHLPHGTDDIQATAVAEAAVERANANGARCLVLPCVPFGNNNTQLTQVATITMRSGTQQAVLSDVAESLVRQGIDRLVIFNFHGGNEFSSMIRDVAMDKPIFIVRVHLYSIAPQAMDVISPGGRPGGHADEMETSLLLHLHPEWVAPLETAGDGAVTPSTMPALSKTPGVWFPRDWAALTKDTGHGNPHAATAAKGAHIFEHIVAKAAPFLVELSAAENGEFPFVVHR